MAAVAVIPRRWATGLLAAALLGPQAGGAPAAAAPPDAAAPPIAALGEVRFVPRGEAVSAIFSEEAIRDRVAREIGTPCEPERIEERVAIPYRALGYVPRVRASCEDGVLRLVIRESSHRIDLVTLDPSELSRIGVSPGARLEDERVLYPVPASAPRDVLLGLLQTRPGDLYNVGRYASDRDALERLGYLLLFVSGPPLPDDEYPAGALLVQSLEQRAEDPKARRRRLNYLGGTASYEPRSGGAAGLIYQRREIFQSLDRLTISPSFATEIGGEISYAAPILAAKEEPRRLYDINVGAYTRFRNDRLLLDQEVDERRSGLFATLGARPLRLAAPHDLRLEAGVRHETVDLDESDVEEESLGLSLLRLGATHVWRHTDRPPALTLRTTPWIDGSLSVGGGTPFLRGGLSTTLHSRRISGLEIDLRLTGGGIDRPVPVSELFSLGGVSTVRGFQEDTHLGRGLAALQSELWIPFARPIEARAIAPGEAGDPSAVPREPSFARRLKAALFLDGGAVWQSTTGGREGLYGAGCGLRFVVPHEPLVIRIDYGWGLGQEGGESYPYVSIGYTR
jgi:hypothetical protein